MKQFFENYGAVALGILALLVLIAMITPVGNLIKTSLQGTVQTFSTKLEDQNNAIDFVTMDSGTRFKIGDRHYIVIEKMGLTSFKVMENTFYNEFIKWDGQESTQMIYENSYVDNWLNTIYYDSLPDKIKNAIVDTEIKQTLYAFNEYDLGKNWEQQIYNGRLEWGYNEENGWIYHEDHEPIQGAEGLSPLRAFTPVEEKNTITRKIFLPSVEEVGKMINLNDEYEVYNFLYDSNGNQQRMFLRDTRLDTSSVLVVYFSYRSVRSSSPLHARMRLRPAYTLDLSKVEFEFE